MARYSSVVIELDWRHYTRHVTSRHVTPVPRITHATTWQKNVTGAHVTRISVLSGPFATQPFGPR